MLLKLHGRHLRALGPTSSGAFIGRIRRATAYDKTPDAEQEILLASDAQSQLPRGFRAYLVKSGATSLRDAVDAYAIDDELHYLSDGDIVRIDPRRGAITTLYRRSSPNNSLLVTERCDNYCLMCSQPPVARDDAWLADEACRVIPLISPETTELGITGGEPGLLGERLLTLVTLAKEKLPRTALHVLTNGRAFSAREFARRLASLGHPDLMLGIPLYSDLPEEHDYVVQARGAFNETIRGILNLKHFGARVEIRVVIHEATFRRLPELAEFLRRNLLFADHVAFMGLEPTGFAKTNLESLWVDPLDYQPHLTEAVRLLDRAGVPVSVYNHQLCVLDPMLHAFSRKSISDWKNTYFEECRDCKARERCGGFFASSKIRRSRGIRSVAAWPPTGT